MRRKIISGLLVLMLFVISVSPNISWTYATECEWLTSRESVVEQIRENIIARNKTFTIYYMSDKEESFSFEMNMFAEAVGNMNEGYYLGDTAKLKSVGISPYQADGNYFRRITYDVFYLTTAEEEAAYVQKISDVLSSLDLENKTEFEQVEAIYAYVCDNVIYAYEQYYKNSFEEQARAYSALMNGEAVCDGYARLLLMLLKEAGIEAEYRTGTVTSGEAHAWNVIKIDDSYYLADSTWDAGKTEFRYFLKSAQEFAEHNVSAADYQLCDSSYDIEAEHTQVTVDGIVYEKRGGNYMVVKTAGLSGAVRIPSTIEVNGEECQVTTIGSYAFQYNSKITSVVLEEGIQYLANKAFWGCDNLETISFPASLVWTPCEIVEYNKIVDCPSIKEILVAEGNDSIKLIDGTLYSQDMKTLLYHVPKDTCEYIEIENGVHTISRGAFKGNTYIKEISMPNSVVMIASEVFSGCENLERVNMSNSCYYIGANVFEGTKLESIYIPASLERMSSGTFSDCKQLKEVIIDKEHKTFSSIDGVVFDGTSLWLYPTNREGEEYIVPEGTSVIVSNAFADVQNLKKIVLLDGIKKVEDLAFNGCTSLEKINFPSSIEKFGDIVLQGEMNLEELILPYNAKKFDASQGNVSKRIVLHANVDEITGYGHTSPQEGSEIFFLGDCPTGIEKLYSCHTLNHFTIYYPEGNETWDDIAFESEYVIWSALNAEDIETLEEEICDLCGHCEHSENVKKPTCVEDGYTGDEECFVCGNVEYGQTIKAIGHVEKLINAKPATCAEDGYTGDYECENCKTIVAYGETIKATGHVEKLINAKPATCTEDGYTGDYECESCKTIVAYGETIKATGHVEKLINAKPATCTEDGYTGDYECENCKIIVICGETIKATGHAEKLINAKPATCTEDGYTGDYECEKCKSIVAYGEARKAIGHAERLINVKSATCTEDGYTGDHECERCKSIVAYGETIKATGHAYDGGRETVAPSIDKCGEKTYTCTLCGDIKKEAISKLNVPTSITSSLLSVSEETKYVSKITAGTTAQSLLSLIHEKEYVTVRKNSEEVEGTSVIATGMILCIMNGTTITKTYSIVVTGDTNGDGKINITDMIAAKAHVLKKTLLTGAQEKAGDVNGDGKINITDFIKIKATLLKKDSITGVAVK